MQTTQLKAAVEELIWVEIVANEGRVGKLKLRNQDDPPQPHTQQRRGLHDEAELLCRLFECRCAEGLLKMQMGMRTAKEQRRIVSGRWLFAMTRVETSEMKGRGGGGILGCSVWGKPQAW